MLLSLTRDTATGAYCQGILRAGALEFQTIERPWIDAPPGKGGKSGVSCVPPGMYQLVRHDTEAHPHSFALVNPALDVYHEPGDVPHDRAQYARVAILIHVANEPWEVQGCLGLGTTRGIGCVQQSRTAMDRFNLTVPWIPGHIIQISWATGVTPLPNSTGDPFNELARQVVSHTR